ncbi:MAG: glycosyltransferase family 9 protein [Calditrichaeota bacterium]|nr:glycosyltransferase family 9 protein [Calditrichota bacterium]
MAHQPDEVSISGNETAGILVVRLSSLGDVVLTSVAIRALRRANPLARIELLTLASWTEIGLAMPEVDLVHAYPGKHSERKRLASGLRDRDISRALDLQNNVRSRILIRKLGITRIVHYHRPRFNRFLRIHFPTLRDRIGTPPAVALQYLEAAAAFGAEDDGGGTYLRADAERVRIIGQRLDEFRAASGIAQDVRPLVVAPGASHPTKAWTEEGWMEFLFRQGEAFLVFVGTTREREFSNRLAARLTRPALNFCGETTPGDLVALLSQSKAFIGSDSGPMHIATAVGTPTVALFGPTVPEFGFAPFRAASGVVQVEGLACRPCHPHGPKVCPLGHFRCMNEIRPQMVEAALKDLLAVDASGHRTSGGSDGGR